MKTVINYLIGLFLITLIYSCSKSDPGRLTDNPVTNYRLRLMGNVKSCNNNNMINGDIIIVTNQGAFAKHISNGYFDTTLLSDSRFDTLIIWAIDLNALTTSDTIRMGVTGDSIHLSQIAACFREVDEYIQCKIDNDTFAFVPAYYDTLGVSSWDTLSAPTTYFNRNGVPLTNSKFYRMQFNGMSTGTYPVNWNSGFQIGRYYSFNMPSSGSTTYHTYGNIGDTISGTLNIPFIDNTDSLNHLLTGRFKVIRDH
jgi:hypothetical protein